ncbi:MAG: fused MFS/spermidine synthase, partial [Actinomycetota bacterium]|nr:fused MFS/spermidine synthase [Actinomycetota bacterium]
GGVLSALSVPLVTALGPSMTNDPASIVVLAALSFLAPTTVLSAISPMVAKARLADLGETGKVIGSLSAAGTFGALAGTFVTGFVLVAALPSRPTVLVVAAALVLAGVAFWVATLRASRAPRRAAAGTTVISLGLVALSGLSPAYCDVESAYSCIRIVPDPDRASGLSLYLADLRNSYVDLGDPTYLDFRYFRLAADVAAALPEGPIDAFHVGGAGFTFPRYLEATRPGSDQLVFEIDEALVDVARDRLGLVTGPTLRVRIGDARTGLDELADDAFDLVVGDVFAGFSAPWHLTTAEVLAEFDRALRPSGIFMANVIDGGQHRFLRAELATMQTAFDHVAVIVPPGGATTQLSNYVVVGSDAPLPAFDVDPADGLFLSETLTDEFIADARVLTDDFAPADQLLQSS